MKHDASNTPPILVLRPSHAAIVLRPWPLLVGLTAVFVAAFIWLPPGPWTNAVLTATLAFLIARLVWEAIWRACVRYELTREHIRATHGVFSRFTVEIPLDRVQHTVLSKSLFERLASVGTIGVASAGTMSVEIVWLSVDRPHQVLDRVREAVTRSRGAAVRERPIVLGLVGGIGSGKSAVARAFESRGALVLDSDMQAKQALRREDVRRALVSWWGDSILDSAGHVDRKKVADIVFSDPAQRTRLESLVHPIVRANREAVIAESSAKGTDLAVIDAPLLFEAGVDRECDAVVYVDSPYQHRIERVQKTRGWNQAELDRREATQMTLDEKRRRSRYVIVNNADLTALQGKVDALVVQIRRDHAASESVSR